MALPAQCPFCATIVVLAEAEVSHRLGARRYRCPSCRSIALVADGPPGRCTAEPPPFGLGDLLQFRALLADEDWLAALAEQG